MIIAAYAGTGKTTFALKNPAAIDMVCMPFKYLNLSDVSKTLSDGTGGESIKANYDLILRRYWELYYYWAVKNLLYYCPARHIMIPTVGPILDFLEADQIPYTIVYPDKSLKAEYEERYKKRGDTEEFLNIFVGQWESRIESLEQRKNAWAKHIVLQKGQYLSDVLVNGTGYDPYVDRQIERFKQAMIHTQSKSFHGIELPESEWDFFAADSINAVFYLKPICEDDAITDFVWISSKEQLKILLKNYQHKDDRTIPELAVLELQSTKYGIRCQETIYNSFEMQHFL